MATSSSGRCGLRRKPASPALEHPVKPFLGDKARAQKNNHVRANAAQTAKRFFAVHERHGEVEQNQVEVGADACGKDPGTQTPIERSRLRNPPRRGLAWQERAPSARHPPPEAIASSGGWRRRRILWLGERGQLRMEQDLFVGTTSVLDQLRRHFEPRDQRWSEACRNTFATPHCRPRCSRSPRSSRK